MDVPEIPADIRQKATDIMDNACLSENDHVNGVYSALKEDIARAILAERERCAEVVEFYPSQLSDKDGIAAAIRSGS